tara:strand:+ start:216 stop:935 length:720 start_codon:yes stop_codon:yes gene_type:complete
MKISKVIITSTVDKNYLDYWPLVKESWENLEIEPVLYIISKENVEIESKTYFIDKLNPVFVAQNLRLLIPALYPNDVCLLSDIDMMPLSKEYFQDSIADLPNDNFIVYRSDATPENMLPICWNAALGSTWGDIFSINNIQDIDETLKKWYPKKYKPYKKNWYIDQIKLREYLNLFEAKSLNRVKYFKDNELEFRRLNRDNLVSDFEEYKKQKDLYVDFHMPRPFLENQELINQVFKLNF